jgi:hypothetical protein
MEQNKLQKELSELENLEKKQKQDFYNLKDRNSRAAWYKTKSKISRLKKQIK